MEDKLKIIKIYKAILNDVYISMINIPKVHYALKELIIKDMFKYLNDLYLANDIEDKSIRIKKKEKVVISFKYIASLIRILNEYKILGQNKYIEVVRNEEILLRLMNKWKMI